LCAETGEHLTNPDQAAEAEKAYARWLLSGKPTEPTKQGRRVGGSNKGFWFRKGRGWYTTEGQRKVALLDKTGEHLKDPRTPEEVLKDAYARYRLGLQEQMKREAVGDTALVGRICQDYLDYAKANNRPSTFAKRGEYLFDFCHGLPAKFWDYGRGRPVATPTAADYLHDGYGNRMVGQLIPMDVQRWLDKHPTWAKGTRGKFVGSTTRNGVTTTPNRCGTRLGGNLTGATGPFDCCTASPAQRFIQSHRKPCRSSSGLSEPFTLCFLRLGGMAGACSSFESCVCLPMYSSIRPDRTDRRRSVA
jgi:hypothetical protein